jgi:hypothetical protein
MTPRRLRPTGQSSSNQTRNHPSNSHPSRPPQPTHLHPPPQPTPRYGTRYTREHKPLSDEVNRLSRPFNICAVILSKAETQQIHHPERSAKRGVEEPVLSEGEGACSFPRTQQICHPFSKREAEIKKDGASRLFYWDG